jgi:hypothetical protein
MDTLHKALNDLHQSAKASGTASQGVAKEPPSAPVTGPFAVVGQVEAGSPAADGGIKLGDRICRFGTACDLRQLAASLQVYIHLIAELRHITNAQAFRYTGEYLTR